MKNTQILLSFSRLVTQAECYESLLSRAFMNGLHTTDDTMALIAILDTAGEQLNRQRQQLNKLRALLIEPEDISDD